MRILHTSDWHIGRTFHGRDLLGDQRAVLDVLAQIVKERGIDVVVVAGDVYDRAVPSAEAVLVCQRAFERIRAAGAALIVTSGNHDSAARLGAGSGFTAAGGLHLLTRADAVGKAVVLADEHGPVAFYGLPYLEPEAVKCDLGVPEARSHAEVVGAAMERVRADLAAQPPGTRCVVIAHAFVVGALPSGSERSISVGGVEKVPASLFEGADYVALGHLHSPQVVSEAVRYSGSPLPYSFGEKNDRKSAWIVDIGPGGLRGATAADLPLVRGLSVLTGTLDELLTAPEFACAEDHYVSAVLTDPLRPMDAMRRLQARFPFAAHMEWRRPGGDPALRYRDRVRGQSDVEVARRFLADVRMEPSDEEMRLVERALGSCAAERNAAK
jgi:exonuclease SbcD